MNKAISIRFNPQEQETLQQIGDFLGLQSQSAIIKACLPWAKQRIDAFLKEFQDVIQPLKQSEIDYLITTMGIIAKRTKEQKSQENRA